MLEIKVTVDIPQLKEVCALLLGQARTPEKIKEAEAPVQADQIPGQIEMDLPKPTYTLEEVRAKAAAVAKSGKRDEIKKILTALGCERVPDLPVDKYDQFMAEVEAL